MIDTSQRVEFIKKSHLFHGLSEEDLLAVARKLEERVYAPEKKIFTQGAEADRFFLIYTGKVRITKQAGSQTRELATLACADYFGEDALLTPKHCSTTATAVDGTTVLTLSRVTFQELIKNIHGLRAKLDVMIASQRLTHRRRFGWLEDGEVVYFIARKHSIELWRTLAGPALAMLLPLALLFIAGFSHWSLIPLVLAGVLTLIILLRGIWNALDWGNDYYIVTNRRVVWLEKVIGLYDSRQEAPLTAILSVNSETDVAGRMFGYGDVIVRTFVGKIIFKTVGYPDEVVALVREYWERTKDVARRTNMVAMKHAMRQKLGLVEPSPTVPPPLPAADPQKTPGRLMVLSSTLFKTRIEEKDSIIYRKHWIVMFRQIWLPSLIGLSLIAWLFNNLFFQKPENSSFSTVLFFLFLVVFLWWLYQVLDWSNDIFQVTSDQILDIDKTPFGRQQKNVALLDNILNTEARREGLLQNILNYGNVYISVGGMQMVFEDVMDPASVQQDIDHRRVARRNKQEVDQVTAERERMAEFFALYHSNAEEFRREVHGKQQPPPPADPTHDPS